MQRIVAGRFGVEMSSLEKIRAPRGAAIQLGPGTIPYTRIRHDYVVRRLLLIADLLAIVVALLLAVYVAPEATHDRSQFLWSVVFLPIWLVLFKVYGLYDRDHKRVSHATADDLPWLFHALVVGSLGLWLLTRFLPSERMTLWPGTVFFCGALILIMAARGTARGLARLATRDERVLFVGGGSMAALLVHKIRHHPEYRLDPIGYVDCDSATSELRDDMPYLGPLSQLESVCVRHAVDRIVLVTPEVEQAGLADLVRVAAGLDLRISILPHLGEVLGPSVEIDDVEGVTVLGINPPALTPSSRLLKRTLDLGVASVVFVAMLPVMALVALAIKLQSPGPIFFSQLRIGQHGKRFWIHKFRTMVPNAETLVDDLRDLSAHPAWLVLDSDPRITGIGLFLRRTSLDELPQLWNVLKGDMSLVGPRPMPPDVDEQISGWGRRRLDLTPGITGLWQVLGRADIPFEEMVKLDYLYVMNWSLWQDVRLLIHTLPAVLRQRGAK